MENLVNAMTAISLYMLLHNYLYIISHDPIASYILLGVEQLVIN